MRKSTSPLQLFPPIHPLESVGIYHIGPLPKSSTGNRFFLVITDRLRKLTQAVSMNNITSLSTAVAFTGPCVFMYAAPASVLSYNGSQFASQFFGLVCLLMVIGNAYVISYHPQKMDRTRGTNSPSCRCSTATRASINSTGTSPSTRSRMPSETRYTGTKGFKRF